MPLNFIQVFSDTILILFALLELYVIFYRKSQSFLNK